MRLNLPERTLPVNLSDRTLVQTNVNAGKDDQMSQGSRLRDEPAVQKAYPERAPDEALVSNPVFWVPRAGSSTDIC